MLLTKAGQGISARIRQSVFRSILQQDTAFFDRSSTGELVNRLSADCTLLQTAVTSSLSQGLRSLFLAVGSLGLMAYLSPPLLLFAVGMFPPVLGTAIYLNRKMKHQQAKVQDALAQATSQAADSLANIRLVREFGECLQCN
jgi:ATP-binding cassette subfamily B (MDR/TAP) protein 10